MRASRGIRVVLACVTALSLAAAASAIPITFDEVGITPLVTTDPGFNADGSFAGTRLGVYQFSAGDPLF